MKLLELPLEPNKTCISGTLEDNTEAFLGVREPEPLAPLPHYAPEGVRLQHTRKRKRVSPSMIDAKHFQRVVALL